MSSRAVADKHGIKTLRAKNHGLGQNVFNHKCETHRTKVNIPSVVTFWLKNNNNNKNKNKNKKEKNKKLVEFLQSFGLQSVIV